MPRRPINDLSCDVWMTVDYGEGPVRVRCTKKGPHEDHESKVILDRYEEPAFKHKNVFDEDDDDDR